MNSDETRAMAREYFDAWSNRSGPEVVGSFLAADYLFTAGDMRIEGRDAFLSSAQWPAEAVTQMVIDVYEDDTGLQVYDATNGEHTVRIAEHLELRDGKIVSSDIVADGAAFAAFMAG